jgi:hypothetical protein
LRWRAKAGVARERRARLHGRRWRPVPRRLACMCARRASDAGGVGLVRAGSAGRACTCVASSGVSVPGTVE